MSSRVSTKPPTGFRDFFGEAASQRKSLENLISKTYQSFGYQPLETPALENLEVLFGSGGGDNEKLVFKTLKRGEKLEKVLEEKLSEDQLADLGLRFDLTVPLCRVVAQYQNEIKFPWKVFHIGPVWRAERAQKGRFREFMQCDVDIIGSKSNAAELDVIQAVGAVFRELDLKDFKLHINDRRLINALAQKSGCAPDKLGEFAVILDKKDKLPADKLVEEFKTLLGVDRLPDSLERILSSEPQFVGDFRAFDPEATDSLQKLLETLNELDTGFKEIVFDPSLARGMGYYTGTVFEVRHASVGYSLGGGGRYDQLTGRFLKQALPACGFSIGFERLLLLLQEQKGESFVKKALFIPVMDEALRPKLSGIAAQLRSKGVAVDIYPDAAKLKKQMQYANDEKFRFVAFIGEEELKNGQIKLKNLSSGEESLSSIENLTAADLSH